MVSINEDNDNIMDAKTIVTDFVDEQGWSDDSVITLLCNFLDSHEMKEALITFLTAQAKEENSFNTDEDLDEPDDEEKDEDFDDGEEEPFGQIGRS